MSDEEKIVSSQIRMPKASWMELKKLAQKEKRSINKEIVYLLEKYIREYEKENK